jgi:hypothetical protein
MGCMPLVSRAWMLDARAFHHEFDELLADASSANDFALFRDRAAAVWRSNDPIARTYLEVLRTAAPDEWRPGSEAAPMIDWYRVLMATYITPTRAFRSPDVLKRRLPDLGWSPAEARRLAQGRELQLLADAFGATATIGSLAPHFTLADKGWLTQDDVTTTLQRMRGLDRRLFRRHEDLIPVVEQVYEVLEAAATKPDLVLLMLAD